MRFVGVVFTACVVAHANSQAAEITLAPTYTLSGVAEAGVIGTIRGEVGQRYQDWELAISYQRTQQDREVLNGENITSYEDGSAVWGALSKLFRWGSRWEVIGGVGLSYFYPTHVQLGSRANVLLTLAVARGPFEAGWRHQSNGENSDHNSSWNAAYVSYRFHWGDGQR
jgi:hypothetical protein